MKVNELRETRTVLLGLAHVQKGRISSVGCLTASFHIHFVFSSPFFPLPASPVTKQFCIINMGPGGSSFSSSSHSVGCSAPQQLLLLQQLSASRVPLAVIEFKWGQSLQKKKKEIQFGFNFLEQHRSQLH